MAVSNKLFKIEFKWPILALIICIVTDVRCSENVCAAGISSIGYTVPAGDIVLRYGEPLEIICSLNENAGIRKNDSSKLRFRRSNETIPSDYVDIINSTTVKLHINNHPKTMKEEYYCIYEGEQPDFVCLNYVAVAVPPQPVTDFQCRSYNYEKLICNWTAPENYIPTHYNLSYSVSGSHAMYQHPCPSKLELNKNQLNCTWSLSTIPQYRHAHDNLRFNLSMYNFFGRHQQDFEISTWKYVIPNAPQNLTGEATSPYSVKLTWINSMTTFPAGTHHKIIYLNTVEPSWHPSILITGALRNKTLEYHLTGLKYANTVYDIRVSMRSAVADPDDETLWSKPSNVMVLTKATIPDRPPETNVGSFEIINKKDSRDVYVYWKKIKLEEENGQNLTYYVEMVDNPLRKPKELKKAYAKFENLLIGVPYTFYIWSVNEIGRSERKSIVRVPSDQERVHSPVNVMKISHSEQVYEIKWTQSNGTTKPLTNYTVFWCSSNKHLDRPFQCDGHLNWVTVSNTTTSYNRTYLTNSDKPSLVEQFAVSANSLDGSSGMSWAECTLLSGKTGKLTNVFVRDTGSSWISIGWVLGCSNKITSVTGYEIIYCQINGNKTKCEDEQKTLTVKGDSKTDFANVTGLQAYKTYRFQIGVKINSYTVSQYSDPIYDVTGEGAPPPPKMVTVSNITENSVVVSWKNPALDNVYIKYSLVYYNDEFKEANRDVTSYKLENLTSFTSYNIHVLSCTVSCSAKSKTLNIVTKIGKPPKIQQPSITHKSETDVTIKWDPPKPPNGRINQYEVRFANDASRSLNVTEPIYHLKECNSKVQISVRAVNINEEGKHLAGDWSDELQYDCAGYYNYGLYIVIAVVITVVAGLTYLSKKCYMQFTLMKNLDPKFPAGIEVTMSDYFDEKHPAEEADPPSPSVKLLEIPMDNGDSSGCSSGQESIASSIQSTTHLSSSDSGTEHLNRSPSSVILRKRISGLIPESPPQTARSVKPSPPEPYVVFGGEPSTQNESVANPPYIQLGDLGSKVPFTTSKVPNDSPPFVLSNNIVKPPNPGGYVPFTSQEPALKNTEYVVAGIPTPKMLMPQLVRSGNMEEQPLNVQASRTIGNHKNVQLPWQHPPMSTADISKTGYVCVGDMVPPSKMEVDISGIRGYVPHKQFESKSIKED